MLMIYETINDEAYTCYLTQYDTLLNWIVPLILGIVVGMIVRGS